VGALTISIAAGIVFLIRQFDHPVHQVARAEPKSQEVRTMKYLKELLDEISPHLLDDHRYSLGGRVELAIAGRQSLVRSNT